jgi:hypothetical protein
MFPHLEERRSDSPFVERVWRTASEREGAFTSISTVHWSIVVATLGGRISVSLHGPETAATRKEHPPEMAWFGIVLAMGTYLPAVPPGSLVDGCIALPGTSQSTFTLCHSQWPIPDFEHADVFVNRLARAGVLVHEPTADAFHRDRTHPSSVRTAQYRFRHATGLSSRTVRLIERARQAAALLRDGASTPDTVFAAGYSDQSHLTRSLKRFIGRTPTEIAASPIVALHAST